ncbi:MAG: AAA family ATPase, partial [Candidatus Rokubacteria bacterium]|nr:AAA family ATPase [Candidatus Rokubacteria bacterium]
MTDDAVSLSLKVAEAAPKDAGRGLVRLDPKDLERLGAKVGCVLLLEGKRKTAAKAMPAFKEDRGHDRIQIDGTVRANVVAAIGEKISVQRVSAPPAKKIVLTPLDTTFKATDARYLASLLDGLPVVAGDRVRAALFGSRRASFLVADTTPEGVVVIHPTTHLSFEGKRAGGKAVAASSLSYEDVGGLEREVARIRELVELPLRYPEVFERLGIEPPKGVLLHGPPGTGKTLIARTVAAETDASFFSIAGPEIVTKFYGESEANLRRVFDEARSKAPSIIFLDEIDAIAPRREHVTGEVEKRIVAQLLSLMDGLSQRGQVVVIGATNIPNALDPALRRPGRFDREIEIPIPDRRSR